MSTSKLVDVHLQSTLTLIRFDTLGGMPLVAMHKYAAMSSRETRAISNTSPSHSVTIEKWPGKKGIQMSMICMGQNNAIDRY